MIKPGMTERPHILVVGRSPSVLVDTVEILRGKGYPTDATNQFDRVLDDYEPTGVDIVVFGGMVPSDTKKYLREEFSARNAAVTFVQGLAGIAGLVARQTEGAAAAGDGGQAEVAYDQTSRIVRITADNPVRVTVEAWWHTSFAPPEPRSASLLVLDAELGQGAHVIPVPAEVPAEASFLTVTTGSAVHAFTVGAMPQSVRRMVPTGGPAGSSPPLGGAALPPVSVVNTRSQDR